MLLKVGYAQVDGFHPIHLVVGKQRSLAHKFLVGLLQQLLVFSCQLFILAVIHFLYAFKQRFVERYLVLQVGQHRLHFLLNLRQLRGFISLRQSEEHSAHTVQLLAAVLIGNDGVLKSSGVFAFRYFRNLVAGLLDGSLESRQIVFVFNLAEIRCSKRQSTLYQQWILTVGLLTGTERCQHR